MRSLAPALLAGLLLILFASGCSSPTEPGDPPDTTEINENIVEVGDEEYHMGAWPQPTGLYATEPFDQFRVGPGPEFEKEKTLIPSGTPAPLFIEAGPDGNKLLYVLTPLRSRPGFWGPLFEFDSQTGEKRLLRDSTHAVSSAVYLPGSGGEKIVYYSYGSIPESNENGPTPGYYLLDTSTGEDSLLLEHRSPAGPEEIFNGFDVSPDGQTLLYPLQYTNIGRFRPPTVLAYDLRAGTHDTLDVGFESQFVWLRYGPEGRQVAYGTYPFGALGSTDSGRSDRIGVIDLSTLEKQVLDTGTHREGPSLDLFPRWSPSGHHLVYGSAPVAADRGAIGDYSLYVLKNVN